MPRIKVTLQLVVIAYNIHSFMDFDGRIDQLLSEFEGCDWDVVKLSKTWRGGEKETFTTRYGHEGFGSGGTCRANGIEILLHKRWANQRSRFTSVSNRVASLEMKTGVDTIQVISVYFPHSSYEDVEADAVYATVDK